MYIKCIYLYMLSSTHLYIHVHVLSVSLYICKTKFQLGFRVIVFNTTKGLSIIFQLYDYRGGQFYW